MSHVMSGSVGEAARASGVPPPPEERLREACAAHLARLERLAPSVLDGRVWAARRLVADVHALAGRAQLTGDTDLAWSARACEELLRQVEATAGAPRPVLDELAYLFAAVADRLAELVQRT